MSIEPRVFAYWFNRIPYALDEAQCWPWRGWTTKGYGHFDIKRDGQKTRYAAHRIACEVANGPAPEGKPNALHKCHNPQCCNPSHLYWGDQKDNARDCVESGRHVPGGRAGVEVCINGHEYTPENTYWEPKGMPCRPETNGRGCRECRREAVRRYRARKRAEVAA